MGRQSGDGRRPAEGVHPWGPSRSPSSRPRRQWPRFRRPAPHTHPLSCPSPYLRHRLPAGRFLSEAAHPPRWRVQGHQRCGELLEGASGPWCFFWSRAKSARRPSPRRASHQEAPAGGLSPGRQVARPAARTLQGLGFMAWVANGARERHARPPGLACQARRRHCNGDRGRGRRFPRRYRTFISISSLSLTPTLPPTPQYFYGPSGERYRSRHEVCERGNGARGA